MSSAATIYLGLAVHKESVTIAVLPSGALAPTRVEKLPNDLTKIRRFCERQAGSGSTTAMTRRSSHGGIARANSPWCASPRKPRNVCATSCGALRPFSAKCCGAATTSSSSWRAAASCTARAHLWRQAHYEWLRQLARADSPLALTPTLASAVATLPCFRGIQQQAAMVLATEISDWQRFAAPRQLMAYLGLVPHEHSSGDRERRGSITKAGNRHCRHVLVQAAWAYRFQPKIGVALKARQRGQSPVVIAHAWKAQHRLHTFYQRLAFRRRPQIAVVAVARELVGFLWAVMRDVTPRATATASCAGGSAGVRWHDRGERSQSLSGTRWPHAARNPCA